MMPSVAAYLVKRKVVVHPWNYTSGGTMIAAPEAVACDTSDPERVGAVCKQLILMSRFGVEHPKSFAGLFDHVLSVAQCANYRSFMRGASCVSVKRDISKPGVLVVISSRNLGPKYGFEDTDELVEVADSIPLELGQAILSRLNAGRRQ